MADLVVISFLTFFFLSSTFPPHRFWSPQPSQNLPQESEDAAENRRENSDFIFFSNSK